MMRGAIVARDPDAAEQTAWRHVTSARRAVFGERHVPLDRTPR
jgi:DNA-binding FadR family transcriptional regulator